MTQPEFDFRDAGPVSRPAIVFLPGSYSTMRAWDAVQSHLPKEAYRLITTSLPGTGGSWEVRASGDADMAHMVRFVANVATRAGVPVWLVGHSFGGMICFAAALSGQVEIAGMVTFEANVFGALAGTDKSRLFEDCLTLGKKFARDVAAGDADAARNVIDYWGGTGAWAAMPENVRAACRAMVAANVLDWDTAATFTPGRADLAALDMPVLLVRGSRANPVIVAIQDFLGDWIPDAERQTVKGAGHFLTTTHAKECGQLLADFLACHAS